ncbi:MAG: glycosyltransferase, partial [Bryobacterales bacterium]|nr:glycosyltransferase [Bryobacterales bacterium]
MSAAALPLRVVLLCTSLSRGGAEKQVVELALELRRRRHSVHVVSLRQPAAFVEDLKSAGVAVSTLRMRPGPSALLGVVRLLALLRNSRPHVLHAHLY